MTILYERGESLYVNITNRCQCNCVFCIRKEKDSINDSESLWLEREPSVHEVIEEIKRKKIEDYNEIVFCGYGEPLVRLYDVVEICKYIKSVSNIKTRVNTNGLANLIHNTNSAKVLEGVVDSISISLNAPTDEEYLEITRPSYGIEAFEAMLSFSKEAKKYVGEVAFSVVDILSEEQILEAKKLAKGMNIDLRIRHKE